jgi:hypothetical protein
MSTPSVVSIETRMATDEDSHIDNYDNTRLVAVNTCPTWGVLRYGMHKVFTSGGRAMPLEAGSACHEVFAAVRLYQLYKYDTDPALAEQFLDHHGRRLFGDARFENMLSHLKTEEDESTQCLNFCIDALYSSGFYDDPSDRRRTMSNLDEACTLYISRWDWHRHPIWIRDPTDPTSDVGIETPFDLVVTFTFSDGSVKQYRFMGKFDGIHWRDGKLLIGENKTASRLDDAWRMSFTLSSQITGYALAAQVWTGELCGNALVWGLAIPLPKSYDNGGLITEHVTRQPYHFERWFDWFLHSVGYFDAYKDNPHDAPKYTHSCNRYFRSCSFVPFCDSDVDEQKLMIEEMQTEEWSPLHETNVEAQA